MTPLPENLELADLLLADPRLRLHADTATLGSFAGVCRPGDGAGPGWVVVLQPDDLGATARQTVQDYRDYAGIICLFVPDADLVAACAQRRVPLIVGEGLMPVDIHSLVAHLRSRVPNLKKWRKLTASESLSSALLSDAPERELLRRYAAMTGETLLLIDLAGAVVVSTGSLPARSVVRWLRGVTDTTGELRLGRWTVFAQLIAGTDAERVAGEGMWLVRGLRSDTAPDPHEPAADALVSLLLVVMETRRTVVRDSLADASQVLHALISPESNADVVKDQLARRGFAEGVTVRMLVGGSQRHLFDAEAVERPAEIAAAKSVPIIIGFAGGNLTVVTTDTPAAADIAGVLPGPVGISEPFDHVSFGPRAWRQAFVAALVAGQNASVTVHSMEFTACSAVQKAAAALGRHELGRCVSLLDEKISALKDGPEIMTALVAHGHSPTKAARALRVHVNTVRNRLKELNARPADLELWALWRAID